MSSPVIPRNLFTCGMKGLVFIVLLRDLHFGLLSLGCQGVEESFHFCTFFLPPFSYSTCFFPYYLVVSNCAICLPFQLYQLPFFLSILQTFLAAPSALHCFFDTPMASHNFFHTSTSRGGNSSQPRNSPSRVEETKVNRHYVFDGHQ